MKYIMLIFLFIAVFVFLFWRILQNKGTQKITESAASYVCPQCNEMDCECRKIKDRE